MWRLEFVGFGARAARLIDGLFSKRCRSTSVSRLVRMLAWLALDQNYDERWPLNPCAPTRIPFMAGQERGRYVDTHRQTKISTGRSRYQAEHAPWTYDLKRSDYLPAVTTHQHAVLGKESLRSSGHALDQNRKGEIDDNSVVTGFAPGRSSIELCAGELRD